LRGILTPVGHGLWTAILGGALFATAERARRGRPRLRASLLGWLVLVALLHALWDASGGIAVWVTFLLTGTPTQWALIRLGQAPDVSATQVHLYTAVSWALMALDAVLGLLLLRGRGRRATRVAPAIAVGGRR
jgi:hypothetical protein